MKDTQKSANSTTASDKTFEGFTDEERGAMKERAQELKAAARRGPRADKADEESAVLTGKSSASAGHAAAGPGL